MKYSHAPMLATLFLLSLQTAQTVANAASQAQKTPANNYIGASISQADTEAICDSFTRCDSGDRGWKIYSGVRLSSDIVVEGGYIDFGEMATYDSDNKRTTSRLSGYTTAALATYQYGDKLELFAKGGIIWWDNERSADSGDSSNDDASRYIGAGASYDLGDNLGIRAEWERFEDIERFEGNTEKIELLSIGVAMSSL